MYLDVPLLSWRVNDKGVHGDYAGEMPVDLPFKIT
jgi:hypothetical protein